MNIAENNFINKIKNKYEEKQNASSILPLAATSAAVSMPTFCSPIVVRQMQNISKKLNKDEINLINNKIDYALGDKITGLKKSGLKIFNITKETLGEYLEDNKHAKGLLNKIAKGKNAVFAMDTNRIFANREAFPLTIFHEMGHAHNRLNSTFWRAMQNSRQLGLVLGTIAAFLPAVTKEEKAKDGCELTKGQKFKNALRKGAPAIALVGTLPTLLEEVRASLKANKWTSQLLSPNLAKKAKNANRLGYLTYIFEAIGLVGGAIAAKHFKDSLDKKKEAKQGSQP